jgi:hypothetical protein
VNRLTLLTRREWWVRYRGEVGYVIGMVGVGIALYGQHQNTDALRNQAQQGAQTYQAVCTFRSDLEQRDAAAVAFLREHPDGVLGITGKVLASQVAQQQKAIHSLSALRCP